MRNTTKSLKTRLLNCSSPEDRLRVIRNSCRGETAYVVSCGPSLLELDLQELKNRLDGKLVISIKQAYGLLEGASDFHLTNFINHESQDYSNTSTIGLELIRPGKPLGHAHINCPIDMKAALRWKDYKSTVAVTKRYDDYLFSKTLVRPLGPWYIL